MNSLTPERLYSLLPTLHRLRDAALAGDPAKAGPLQALLAAFAREFARWKSPSTSSTTTSSSKPAPSG